MALSSSTVLEIRTGGNSANGGGFNVGNANFATDLAATSGTSTAPVVSSASYTFVAGDVGASLFVKSGTNWIKGFYTIASVSGGNATLTATIGSVCLYGGATVLNTAAGVATTASPSGGTFGVDYSQQASPQFTFTDMVIDGTTNTKFTSAANPVGKNFVGNLINVTSGTGFTVQRVEVVSTATTTATCDKSLGTLSSTGGNGKLGGCLDGLVTASGVVVAGNKIFMAAGAYTQTASATFSVGGAPDSGSPNTRLIGYSSYRGDVTATQNPTSRPVITLSTNTGLIAVNCTGQGWRIENIEVNCASLGTSKGIAAGQYGNIYNCKVSNFTAAGLYVSSAAMIAQWCEVTGGTSAATAAVHIAAAGNIVSMCNIHDNACPGVATTAGGGTQVVSNLITNNTGATSDGVTSNWGDHVLNNTIYGNGQHGVSCIGSNITIQMLIRNNILASNGGFGLKFAAAGYAATPFVDGNAYWSNTSGTRSNTDDLGTTNAVNGVTSYVNAFDVILSADPFVAKASNDYRLNTTAGGGAACRGFGVPTTWPGNSLTVSAPDMGAVQHVDSGGSGGPVRTNFRGGFSNG